MSVTRGGNYRGFLGPLNQGETLNLKNSTAPRYPYRDH